MRHVVVQREKRQRRRRLRLVQGRLPDGIRRIQIQRNGMIYVICLILASFKDIKIQKRTIISSTNYKTLNRQLLLSNSLFSIILLMIYVVLSFILVGDIMSVSYTHLQNSCNPGFVKMGQLLGKETLFSYIDKFGFGRKTGVDLNGEGKGII